MFNERKLNRFGKWDYSDNGWYFVTFNVYKFLKCFGKIENNIINFNKYGEIANKYWLQIPKIHKNIELDEFIVMPDHFHGILIIKNNVGTGHCPVQINQRTGQCPVRTQDYFPVQNINIYNKRTGQCPVPTQDYRPVEININIYNKRTGQCPVRTNNIKYELLSKIINGYKNMVTKEIRKDFIEFKWHRSFYDRVIRTEKEYLSIKQYIRGNPKNANKEDLKTFG